MLEDVQVDIRLFSVSVLLQWGFILFGLAAILLDFSKATCLVGLGVFGVGIFISWLMGLHVAFFSLREMDEDEDLDGEY